MPGSAMLVAFRTASASSKPDMVDVYCCATIRYSSRSSSSSGVILHLSVQEMTSVPSSNTSLIVYWSAVSLSQSFDRMMLELLSPKSLMIIRFLWLTLPQAEHLRRYLTML